MKIHNYRHVQSPPPRIRCPVCGHNGTFEYIGVMDVVAANVCFGQRRCPNPDCHAHIFFVKEGDNPISTFPPVHIDFEKKGIPKKVLSAFEETVICHANKCYIASAILIRKTLEEICQERSASGDNLKLRIKALGNNIVIPKELLEGMDELRLLGNDAAHVESRIYDKISKNEVEVSIEFTKEILKAVYQYEQLLNKLKSLKKNDTKT